MSHAPKHRSLLLRPGFVVDGRWLLTGQAGRGPAGPIFDAMDQGTGQQVRVRTAEEPPVWNTVWVAHPRVARTLVVGREDQVHYVVQERFEGTPLTPMDLRRVGGRLARMRTIALDVLDALGCLHQRQGRVHGGLSLRSLWLEPNGHVRLVDVGSTPKLSPGAVAFASPERLRGEAVDAQSDLYSLACVLYAVLTGAPPHGWDPESAREGHLAGHPVEAPPGLQRFFTRALAVEAEARFPSADAMRQQLIEGLRAGPPDSSSSHPTLGMFRRHASEITELVLRPIKLAAPPRPLLSPITWPSALRPVPLAPRHAPRSGPTEWAVLSSVLGFVAACTLTGGGALMVLALALLSGPDTPDESSSEAVALVVAPYAPVDSER